MMSPKKNWKNKIVDPNHLPDFIEKIKKSNQTIVSLNGSFDLMHAGHLHILSEAVSLGDILIVALNSDNSIKQYKSPHRPIISLNHRLEMMAAIVFIDFVTWFDEPDPRNILKVIRPNVHVNGAEYGENCIESQIVKEGGGSIYLVNRIGDFSTSTIISRIGSLVGK